MFPETKYHRPHPKELTHDVPMTEVSSSASGSDEKSRMGMVEEVERVETSTSKSAMPNLSQVETAARDPHLGKGYPSKSQWRLYQPNSNPIQSLIHDLILPWKLFAFPIVEFAAFVVSFSCSSFLTLNLTQAQVFAAPPYNFSSATIGYFNFAVLIGAFIGLGTSGKLSDWVADRATKRNGGIREPEMRLIAMIPYVIIMVSSIH